MTVSMYTPPVRHSRLAKQENKRMAKQTVLIIGSTVIFLIAFFSYGIPGLMKLAVVLGNSKTSSKFAAVDDTVPPLSPILNPIPEATSSATINLSGSSEPGAVITLLLDGSNTADSAADNQGNFFFLDIKLNKGVNAIQVVATDQAGNKSPDSPLQQIALDTEAPVINLDTPKDGDKVYGALNQLIDVTGTTKLNAQLMLNERQIVVTGDGSFSAKYQLSEGDNTLNLTVTDQAGNQSVKTVTVNFSK